MCLEMAMRQRRDPCAPVMGGSPYRAVCRAVLRGARRVWHDLRAGDLYRSGKEFELMARAMGFAALALLTVIPLLIVVAAVSPAPHHGLAVWVVYGMGLTGSSAGAVTQIFSALARVLGTTSVFSAVLLGVAGVSFAGSVQAGFERIWGCPAGPWHKIWRQAVWLAVTIAYSLADATVGTLKYGGLPGKPRIAPDRWGPGSRPKFISRYDMVGRRTRIPTCGLPGRPVPAPGAAQRRGLSARCRFPARKPAAGLPRACRRR